jgi:hypothetical protein
MQDPPYLPGTISQGFGSNAGQLYGPDGRETFGQNEYRGKTNIVDLLQKVGAKE